MGEYFRIMEEAENDAVLGALQVQDRTPFSNYPPPSHHIISPLFTYVIPHANLALVLSSPVT